MLQMILLTDFPIFNYERREYIGHYSFILYFSQSGKLHILQAKYSGMSSSVKVMLCSAANMNFI